MEALSIEDIIRKTVAECLKQTRPENPRPENPPDCWVCPVCRNWFAWDDGSRLCTHDKGGTCKCPDMPAPLRRIRDLALLRRSLGCDQERTEAFERIKQALR